MFRFPWGDMHSLNLGWFLQKFNELREDWATAEAGIDGALDAEIQRAEDALSDVFDARDAAAASATAAAGSASAANTSKTAAQNSATAAASSATLANNKATAAGLSEAAAAQSATAASNSASAAATSATQAGNSASAAQQSKTDAASDALKSEGHAVGKQNGTDVQSGSPYYHNNAKYYAESIAGDAAAAAQSAQEAQEAADNISSALANIASNTNLINLFLKTIRSGFLAIENFGRGTSLNMTIFYNKWTIGPATIARNFWSRKNGNPDNSTIPVPSDNPNNFPFHLIANTRYVFRVEMTSQFEAGVEWAISLLKKVDGASPITNFRLVVNGEYAERYFTISQTGDYGFRINTPINENGAEAIVTLDYAEPQSASLQMIGNNIMPNENIDPDIIDENR